MPLYVIEGEVPDAGSAVVTKSRKATLDALDLFEELDERIQRVQCYVVEDMVYGIYFASDEGLVREHARKLGVPVTRISRVRGLLRGPVSGEEARNKSIPD